MNGDKAPACQLVLDCHCKLLPARLWCCHQDVQLGYFQLEGKHEQPANPAIGQKSSRASGCKLNVAWAKSELTYQLMQTSQGRLDQARSILSTCQAQGFKQLRDHRIPRATLQARLRRPGTIDQDFASQTHRAYLFCCFRRDGRRNFRR